MQIRANKTRTTLLMLCHNEVVSYLKSNPSFKINSQTPNQHLQSFNTFHITFDNPITTSMCSKDNTKTTIRRGISKDFAYIVKELNESACEKDELDTYINDLQGRKVLFSKHKLQSCEQMRRDECVLMNRKDEIHYVMKNAIVMLKRMANNFKKKKICNEMSIESPQYRKSISSITSNESSTSLPKKRQYSNKPYTPKYKHKTANISPLCFGNKNTNNISHNDSKENSFNDTVKVKRSFHKKKTFNSKVKCSSEFKIDLIEQSTDTGSTPYKESIVNGKGSISGNIPLYMKCNMLDVPLCQYSPDKKMNVFRENSDLSKKQYKKSKTNVMKLLKQGKKSKFIDQLIALYPSKSNDSSISD